MQREAWESSPESTRGARAQTAVQFVGILAATIAFERGGLGGFEPMIEDFANRYPAMVCWRFLTPLVRVTDGERSEPQALLHELADNDVAVLPRDANWLIGVAVLALACTELEDAEPATTLYRLLEPFEGRVVVVGAAGALWGA
jgi:hypothetical protein